MADEDVQAQGDRPWEELQRILDDKDPSRVEAFLEKTQPGEMARVISRLSEEDQAAVLHIVDTEHAADVVELIPEAQASRVIEQLDPREAAEILTELPSNEQADLIAQIGEEGAQAILAEFEPAEATAALELSRYPADVAGGLMVREFLSYTEDQTIGDVVEDLRQNAEKYETYDVQYAYVRGAQERLAGVLRLRDLLLRRSERRLGEIMITSPHSVSDRATLEELRTFFDEHRFVGVPVVDEAGRLVGVVREAAVEEGLHERSDSDFRKSQGIVGGEELRSFPVLLRSKRRLAWLSVNIVLNVIAVSVIAYFEDTLAAVIALAMFLPIVSDMSGCSGNQAVAVSIRELTLGIVRPGDALRVWLKEVAVGAINGIVLGLLIGVVGWVWKGSAWLGAVVGAALFGNTVVAVSIGGLIPLVLKRMRLDPALASGPILTTVTDMSGFFFLLGLATLVLSRISTG